MKNIVVHVDGSICTNRLNMPSKANVARYWCEKSTEYFDYSMDWGEPSCWACGIWNEYFDDDIELEKLKDVFSVWNKHSYLERCHILPTALGGCNCEANLTILCKHCHKVSPDTRNLHLFTTWVKNRKSHWVHSKEELQRVLSEFDYQIEESDKAIMMSNGFKLFLETNTVMVGGKTAIASYIACFIEYKRLHR